MPPANPKPDLLQFFARIDELARQLPSDADPALLHYLQKKSYEKARLHLQGRDAENRAGNCRHENQSSDERRESRANTALTLDP
jgi:hypothetical protein